MSRNKPRIRSLRRIEPRRIIAAILVGAVGLLGVGHTLAYCLRGTDVGLAQRMGPFDGRITALAASSLSSPSATNADRSSADVLARKALREDALAVVATSTLAFNAAVRGDNETARKLFGFTESLSRRDIRTQLWAIEYAVSRNDINGALLHYDVALRTTPASAEVLYPVLVSATSDPEIRAALLKRISTRPPWAETFVTYLTERTSDMKSAALLVRQMHQAGGNIPATAQAAVINALIAGGFADDAWNFFVSFHSNAQRYSVRNPGFISNDEPPSALDWTVVNNAGIYSALQRDEASTFLDFQASPTASGTVVSQSLLLDSGKYRMISRIKIDSVSSGQIYWRLACQRGREIGRMDLSTQHSTEFWSDSLQILPDCPIQILELVVSSSGSSPPIAGRVFLVSLTKQP